MSTYLLTWNPAKWPWDDLAECIHQIRTTGYYLERWSCGRNRKIVEGDRVFLLRQGLEPRGIVGSGWAVSDVFDDWHWDEAKRAARQRVWCIDVRFDILLDADREPILTRGSLNDGVLGQMHWDSQSSGILIPEHIARRLEVKWCAVRSIRDQKSAIQNDKDTGNRILL